jgi:hypothetical protein
MKHHEHLPQNMQHSSIYSRSYATVESTSGLVHSYIADENATRMHDIIGLRLNMQVMRVM